MNQFLRTLLRPIPWILKGYLSRRRNFQYKGLEIAVMPGVFHPGLFHSTAMLLKYVEDNVQSGSVLEIGGGTGIVSIQAARLGAEAVSTDISHAAIANMRLNASSNRIPITIIHSDLFENIQKRAFDWIFVNPPYYPRNAKTEEDFAWYCGEGHEYFVRFFDGIRSFIGDHTTIIMVLSEVCNLQAIFGIASSAGFIMEPVAVMSVWVDGKNFLFRIKPSL